jgi:hypothetical protein
LTSGIGTFEAAIFVVVGVMISCADLFVSIIVDFFSFDFLLEAISFFSPEILHLHLCLFALNSFCILP